MELARKTMHGLVERAYKEVELSQFIFAEHDAGRIRLSGALVDTIGENALEGIQAALMRFYGHLALGLDIPWASPSQCLFFFAGGLGNVRFIQGEPWGEPDTSASCK